MIKYILLVVLLIGCSSTPVTKSPWEKSPWDRGELAKYPNQIANLKSAPSFHNSCANGEYGEWSKNMQCAK